MAFTKGSGREEEDEAEDEDEEDEEADEEEDEEDDEEEDAAKICWLTRSTAHVLLKDGGVR